MGFMLVAEGMFRSVAWARDRWLAPNGVVLPAECTVWLAPFSNVALVDKLAGYWCSRPYGVDLSVLAPRALEQRFCRPVIDVLPEDSLLAAPVAVWYLDCATMTGDDADEHIARFDFSASRPEAPFHGLAAWFTCMLCDGVELATGPDHSPTHWEQTLLFVGTRSDAHGLALGEGGRVTGKLRWLVAGLDMGVAIAGEVTCADEVAPKGFVRRLVLNMV
mmetsp:Transcript_63971/g.164671  ORF Transcript_63971/g.164671 Transcript_63971/m.164671 type:complete len:219 (+) Transcript_63971:3-659(+)